MNAKSDPGEEERKGAWGSLNGDPVSPCVMVQIIY